MILPPGRSSTRRASYPRTWILRQGPTSQTEAELAVLKQMQAGYELYMRKARDLQARMAASSRTSVSLAEYNDFSEQSRRLSDLSQALGRARFEARTAVLGHANRTSTQLLLSGLGAGRACCSSSAPFCSS